MTNSISAVLVHVADVTEGLAWYQRAFPTAQASQMDGSDFVSLLNGETHLEIVPADDKVASGAAGTVVYWRVDDIAQAVAHFDKLGAKVYRGPLQIENALWMCQVRNPWGNCIGLRGPKRDQQDR